MNETLEILKSKGFKITKARQAIIESLQFTTTPLSINELENVLKNLNLTPNTTTIYREINFLKEQSIIKEVDFGEGLKRYEFDYNEHHHHIICIKCKQVEDVALVQDLSKEEKRIAKEKNYKIINHSLEFFGICINCQKI